MRRSYMAGVKTWPYSTARRLAWVYPEPNPANRKLLVIKVCGGERRFIGESEGEAWLTGKHFLVVAGAGAGYIVMGDIGYMANYVSARTEASVALERRPQASDIIHYATLATNSHNTQP